MNEPRLCPDCGAEFPADSPAGQCPKCLLKAGFESEAPSHPEPEPTAPSPATSGFQPPSVEDLAPRFPQLEILELAGRGGMGAVYKARQPGLDRLVAVKILPSEVGRDPAFAERFTREARALARLTHPNIVSVYDFGQSDGLYYFIMEYVDGANLRQTIQAGKLSPEEALAIVPQICDALQYAHDEDIVHRDIKPENILLDKKGRVKIADFGLSKLLREDQPDVSLTGTHQVMGTVRYMAPEQMQGTKSVDHRADIYSLGVVFYELLTGDVPMGRFAPPSQKVLIDVRLDEVVLRALEQEPDKRYQHASEVKSDVETVVRQPAVPSAAPPGRQFEVEREVAELLRKDNKFGAVLLYQRQIGATEEGAQEAVEALRRLYGIEDFPQSQRRHLGRILLICFGLLAYMIYVLTSSHSIEAKSLMILPVAAVGIMWIFIYARRYDRKRVAWEKARSPSPPRDAQQEPRLSRCALAAAILLPVGLGTIAFPAYFVLRWIEAGPGASVVFEAVLFVFGLAVLGMSVPTLLGGIAVAQIRQSKGKLYGLPLAAFDLLLFPLLALGGATFALTHLCQSAIWTAVSRHDASTLPPVSPTGPRVAFDSGPVFFLLDAIVAAAVCYFAGRAAWRKIAGDTRADDAGPRPKARTAWLLIGGALLLVVLVRFAQVILSTPFDPMILEYEVVADESSGAPPVDMPALLRAVEVRANSGFRCTALVRSTKPGSRPTIEISINRDNPEQHQRVLRRMQMKGTFVMRVLAHRQADAHLVAWAQNATGDDVHRADQDEPRQEIVARWITLPPPGKPFMPGLLEDENVVKRSLADGGRQVLALVGQTDVHQFHIRGTSPGADPANQPILFIDFTPEGADRATALTTTYRSTVDHTRYLAIIVDGLLQNAPRIVGTVSKETSIGGFATEAEAVDLAAVLESGTFPAPLKLVGGTDVFMAAEEKRLPRAADSGSITLEGEEHLPFSTLFFKAGETVKPTEKVIYYKTPFASPPYLTFDLKVPFAPEWETGYQVTNERADSFTLQRMTPSRFRIKVEANGEIMPQSGPAHEPTEALKFKWKAEGRPATGVPDPATKGEGEPTSKPTEADGKKTLEQMFAASGVPVKVVRFSRTEWKDYYKFVPPQHDMAYEAEIEFQKECQMKEQQSAHWSPWQKPNLDRGYSIIVGDLVRFKKGEQKTIRGCLVFKWKSGSWRQDNNLQVAF